MTSHKMIAGMVEEFAASLRREERSKGTIAKYLRDVRRFAGWMEKNRAVYKGSEGIESLEKADGPETAVATASGGPNTDFTQTENLSNQQCMMENRGSGGAQENPTDDVSPIAEQTGLLVTADSKGLAAVENAVGNPDDTGEAKKAASATIKTSEGYEGKDTKTAEKTAPIVTKETAIAWKDELIRQNYAPTTVNSMLAAMNSFFRFAGWTDCKVKALKVQRKIFRDASKNLRKEEYERLVKAAKDSDKEWLALLMETICATGIRVSEVRYITVEAAMAGRTDVQLKGKIRTILLPGKLCKKLRKYAKKEHLVSGEIFLTRNGNPVSRRQIWAEMKALCGLAGVEPSKVFPHNLRHLFARTFFKNCKDIVKLADLMGHSSVETTRLYLISTGEEHERCLNKLKLVS